MTTETASETDMLDALLQNYRPPIGSADELLDASGEIRPAWRPFVSWLAGLQPDDITRRFGNADQYLRDAGVFFRQYGEEGAAERDWPLSHVPVVINQDDWAEIAEGLTQRADLLEALVADLYGPNRLVRDGYLPASLIARSPEWLRPLVGVAPRSGHFLHFIAFEIGRGPDGTWWVLGDRTQAPSGAGFALENRVATTRAFSDFLARAHVHRLAGFFREFRDALTGLRGEDEGRASILTPGPHNDTYYEHAYIARYLGLWLLQGEDLTVQDGRVMVRTISGLRPLSVLWRRVDAEWVDPLELNEGSRLGTAGLIGAIRSGNLTMVNALGSGVLETRALLAFLPRVSKALRGESLKLPNVATWWCGQEAERDHVKANLDQMLVDDALSTRLPFEAPRVGQGRRPGPDRDPEALLKWIDGDPGAVVGQEVVTLSTTPAYVDGELRPRPMSLRVFLARTPNGWTVMPGGFARIGHSDDPTAIAMQKGGSAADVWIAADGPVDQTLTLTQPETPFRRRRPPMLPSRAADNLYWLGRYIERSEGLFRLTRAYHARLTETEDPKADLLLAMLRDHLAGFGVETDECLPEGLCAAVEAAVMSASQIRDRFSIDGWTALSELRREVNGMRRTVQPGTDCAAAMGVLLRKITGFSGLVHENMYRVSGWRFLRIGLALERALATTSALAVFADPESHVGGLDLAVEIGDSVMSHRRRYTVATSRPTVVDLLALDDRNPRSVLYQLSDIRDHVDALPGANVNGQLSELAKSVLRAETDLMVQSPETLDTIALYATWGAIAEVSERLSEAYLR
ncbi:putative circularly permuted ATP-grasp superfamily protein/putative alpha-E superfamily protein [Rhodobium orientis]|nr:circularly permuted type 2 ATP-grasp protein [Rhodobium orientis]MBB4304956.1 putative circularly permuted ATP-grasp superfamily protein/putative alpha-E superfamily protein [Rhodobium orientis]